MSPIRFRDNDFWQPLADSISEAVAAQQGRTRTESKEDATEREPQPTA